MKIRRTERYAGFFIAETHDMPWWAYRLDKVTKTIVCGEIGHVKFGLWRLVAKQVMRHEARATLDAFAHRVGVEYTDSSTTTTRSDNEEIRS